MGEYRSEATFPEKWLGATFKTGALLPSKIGENATVEKVAPSFLRNKESFYLERFLEKRPNALLFTIRSYSK